MLGYEAGYDSRADDKTLLDKTKLEGATLLTRDADLYRRACSRGLVSVLVQGETDETRLGQLAKTLGLILELDMANTRCPKCGSSLHQISRSEASTSVPVKSLNLHDNFWKCTNMGCGKTYWLGSHVDNIQQSLEKARLIVDKS